MSLQKKNFSQTSAIRQRGSRHFQAVLMTKSGSVAHSSLYSDNVQSQTFVCVDSAEALTCSILSWSWVGGNDVTLNHSFGKSQWDVWCDFICMYDKLCIYKEKWFKIFFKFNVSSEKRNKKVFKLWSYRSLICACWQLFLHRSTSAVLRRLTLFILKWGSPLCNLI